MSAFLCNPAHIGAVARNTKKNPNFQGDVVAVAEVLARENIKAIERRYPDIVASHDGAARSFFPDIVGNEAYVAECKVEAQSDTPLYSDAEVGKLVSSYEYQACESDNYEQSLAKSYISAIKLALSHYSKKEYDDAAWEV